MSSESNLPEKMDLGSMDIAAENRARIKDLFPSVFTETVSEKGELVESIDFEKLKAEFGTFSEVFESRRERYGMDWTGKKDCMKLIQEPSIGTLKPCREESVNFDSTENLFIEGDNLEVLKLLQKAYFGKIKMIYIDPPYNTGNEFIYPDDYSESLDTYLAYSGLTDSEGKKFSTNTPNEGRFHTKWINMMLPRLYLARNLLRDDGVIFISIDDHELANLKKLCDEIFGEERFIATLVWKSRQNKDNRNVTGASIDHEYIICYGKSIRGAERNVSQYDNPDNDPRGPWTSANMVGLATAERRPNLHYDLIDPATGINYGCPDMGWRYDINTMSRLISEGRILWSSSPQGRPRRKAFLNELTSEYTGFSSLVGENCYTRNGTADIDNLFGYRAMDFPKPVQLLKEIIPQGISSKDEDIILDFFAGSCSTAHAILELNSEDNGKRKFIMVQLPEPCAEGSEPLKAGLSNIADIGKERIRRVIQKIDDERTSIPDPQQKISLSSGKMSDSDFGFKVFKLDRSNFRIWDGSNPKSTEDEIAIQLTMHVDHVLPSATQEDILFELLIKSGFMPTEKVKKLELADKTVFSIADGALLICLEDKITRELIDEVAKAEPMQFVCLDKGFRGNDQLKSNAVQTFAARNQGRDKAEQIVFKTV